MTKSVIHETRRLEQHEIIDISFWEVPVTKDNPDGVTYSLNYRIFDKDGGRWKSIIRYDNSHKYKNHKTRHHRHIGNKVIEIKFKNVGILYNELLKLREKFKREGKIKKKWGEKLQWGWFAEIFFISCSSATLSAEKLRIFYQVLDSLDVCSLLSHVTEMP